jgi:transketolase
MTPPLDARSLQLRNSIVDAMEGGGRGHLGPALSLVEILRVLYDDILRFRPQEPLWPDRDRCILSKGHGCLALYAILADKGYFDASHLKQFCKAGAMLGGHPEHSTPGVEASTGALGHGLPIGVGVALAMRMQKRDSRVFVVTGDGELGEGSIWEAALMASKHGLDNLTVMVDHNKLQSYGLVTDVCDLAPLADKWRSFGFHTVEVDGHDVEALRSHLTQVPFTKGKPSAVICHTIKGKGVRFAEQKPNWHHTNKADAKMVADIRAALAEV